MNQRQAVEAITNDTQAIFSSLETLRAHDSGPLLLPGALPNAAMYVVESYRALRSMVPEAADLLDEEFSKLLGHSRHRAKLLDQPGLTPDSVAAGLTELAERQASYFLELHSGILGWLKRALQPEMGISRYDGHVFSTTDVTGFQLGIGDIFSAGPKVRRLGEVVGAYLAAVSGVLGIERPEPTATLLDGSIDMRDLKGDQLYRRGSLGQMPSDLARGATLLLVNLNHVRLIFAPLMPAGGLSQHRIKLIVAYHADSALRSFQTALRGGGEHPAIDMLSEVIGTRDARWLRKRRSLRNLLVHYLGTADEDAGDSRTNVIERHSGSLSFDESCLLLDRHIDRMAHMIEEGFDLQGDPFWLGAVK